MSFNPNEFNLSKEDIHGITPDMIEHIIWFNAEDSLSSIEIEDNELDDEENKNIRSYFEDLCNSYDNPVRLILNAHFLELLKTEVSEGKYFKFEKIAQTYQDIIINDGPVIDPFTARIIEGFYVYEEFIEDETYKNPILYMLETLETQLPEEILGIGKNLPPHAIIFLYASFCVYDKAKLLANLLDAEKITENDIKKSIEKLALLLENQ